MKVLDSFFVLVGGVSTFSKYHFDMTFLHLSDYVCSNPLIIVVHGNRTEHLPESYKRYLKNKFIKILRIHGTSVRFEFKTGENPFAGKRNKLTPRQQRKKVRFQKHVKVLKKARKK